MKLLRLSGIALILAMLALAGCSKVPAGNVGVKVFLLGGEKGVDHEELGVGRYWIGVNEELYLFPTFTQNYVWTRDPAEGSENDESITFQTSEGLSVNGDVGISYHINGEQVSTVFQKYRRGVNEITDIFLRNMVRDAFNAKASVLPVEAVYGKGKAALLADVEAYVKEQVAGIGINIEKIYLIGSLRLPDSVVKALDAKIAATQKAQQRENEVAQAKAEADKVREEAKGSADAILFKAEAEAQALEKLGAAIRRNPQVIQLRMVDKWNGIMPRVMGAEADLMLMLQDEKLSSK